MTLVTVEKTPVTANGVQGQWQHHETRCGRLQIGQRPLRCYHGAVHDLRILSMLYPASNRRPVRRYLQGCRTRHFR
jgi:hypothetical protein